MSNIQITENASGKYSPEWFYSESQTPEWISFAHKADELRENFINLFGIERLKSLSGKDLLTSLFYNDEGTKTNLCYILEMDKDIREVFGSISGGAAYKFGLFYHKKNQSWTCGSPLKPVLLTEAEAIQKADEMRNDLVEGAEIISSFGPLDSEEDYFTTAIPITKVLSFLLRNRTCFFREYFFRDTKKDQKLSSNLFLFLYSIFLLSYSLFPKDSTEKHQKSAFIFLYLQHIFFSHIDIFFRHQNI